jgi:hypothetical protein
MDFRNARKQLQRESALTTRFTALFQTRFGSGFLIKCVTITEFKRIIPGEIGRVALDIVEKAANDQVINAKSQTHLFRVVQLSIG